jgi:twitching motility protein PilT
MAQLDQFIQVLSSKQGDAITITSGEPITMVRGTAVNPMTKKPVDAAVLLTLVREIAPPDLRDAIDTDETRDFRYASPSGEVDVAWRPAEGTGGGTATLSLVALAGSAPVPAGATSATPAQDEARRMVEGFLRLLVQQGGSDLHLRVGEPPILRFDGSLIRQEGAVITGEQLQAMHESLMLPQDIARFNETGDADYAFELSGVARFRCNAARDRAGPFGVFRVIPSAIPDCDALGITSEVQRLCFLTKGLVVVTGPTGSGKSTTLAALVDVMNRERSDHILTIEDPIEFVHASKSCLVTHRQVGLHTASFKAGLRAALREDPDIILIGELRDLETVAIAIETAETGHLVFGTLHTTTASSTIDRIIDQFPPDQQAQIRVMLSESLRGVIAQTLCKRIDGGRVAAREVLLSNTAISNLIREGKTFQIPSIIQTNRKAGMTTLNDSLLDLVERQVVEPKEAWMKSADRAGLEQSFEAKGIRVPSLMA